MAHTTGTVDYFADQSGVILGLLGTLLDWLASVGYEETIGTGDGVETDFAFTLTNTTVADGQCRIRYKIGGVDYETWDDGEGAFSGDKISSGTLNPATGAGTINFTEPLDDTYVMKAKYTTGTASQDWLTLRQEITKTNAGADAFPGLLLQECIFKNSGVSFKDFVGVGIREWQQPANQRWGWNLNLYKTHNVADEANDSWNFNSGWSGLTGYGSSTHNYNTHPATYFKNAEQIKYWFIANKRRIIIVARTASTNYMTVYLGFGKRLSTPAEYPYPGLACGNGNGDKNFADSTLTFIAQIIDGSNTSKSFGIKPSGEILTTYNAHMSEGWTWTNSGTIKKTTDSKVNLFPLYLRNIAQAAPLYEVLYELDGVFRCPNEGLVAEDTITIGGDTYLIVPNIYRSNFYDYMAVKLE